MKKMKRKSDLVYPVEMPPAKPLLTQDRKTLHYTDYISPLLLRLSMVLDCLRVWSSLRIYFFS